MHIMVGVLQEPMTQSAVTVIKAEHRNTSDISDTLATIDVCVGYLATVGGKPETKLKKFLTKIGSENMVLGGKVSYPHLNTWSFVLHL